MYELIYSDGCLAIEKFNSKNRAIESFYKKISKKGMKRVALYRGGIGFHSATQFERVIMFFNDPYLIAKSQYNKQLKSKRVF